MKKIKIFIYTFFIGIFYTSFPSTKETPTLAHDSIKEIMQYGNLHDLLQARLANQNFYTLAFPFLYLRYLDAIKTIDLTYILPNEPLWHENIFALKQIQNFCLPYAACNEEENELKNRNNYIYKEYVQEEQPNTNSVVRTLNGTLLRETFDNRYEEVIEKLTNYTLIILKTEDTNDIIDVDYQYTYYYFPELIFYQENTNTMNYIIEKYGHQTFDKEGSTIIHWASRKGYIDLIYGHTNTIHIQDKRGYTPLIQASCYDQTEIVQYLLSAGADPNTHSDYRYTALLLAAHNADIINLLIKAGSNIDHQNQYGTTALMWAASRNYLENVKYLLTAGANPKILDSQERTALDFADRNNHCDIIELLTNDRNN